MISPVSAGLASNTLRGVFFVIHATKCKISFSDRAILMKINPQD
jgi:hypothetical protein